MSLRLHSAKIQSHQTVLLTFSNRTDSLNQKDFSIVPQLKITSIDKFENFVLLHVEEIDIKKLYHVFVKGLGSTALVPDRIFEEYVSDKIFGCTRDGDHYFFRLFSPRALSVILVMYVSLEDALGTEFEMTQDEDGVWEISLAQSYVTEYYCYKISGTNGQGDTFDHTIAVADPYSCAVVTRNDYRHEARTQIIDDDFDWGDDAHVNVPPGDLIIYEMHVRDLTAHPTARVTPEMRGTYKGFLQEGSEGGITYIKSLGVNAVELMPLQAFAKFEPPYKQLVAHSLYNTWNPYERNHWGYMTQFFFAPEAYYATGSNLERSGWCEAGGRQVREFKELVQALHREGISVIMDVVYNHTSQYDVQPFKFIDKRYYYHLDAHGHFRASSGCGNDFHTARAMSRRFIIDSVRYWMEEYHVDGFRFDLAPLIDWDTFEELIMQAQAINPEVTLIAEPWGGGLYDVEGFSERGMAAWNDIFRNAIKGHNPHNALGCIFGTGNGDLMQTFYKCILGCTKAVGGPFSQAAHSINYLEAHDGYTLGDFIRIGSGELHAESVIKNIDTHAKLSQRQSQLNKLAAFILFVSKGSVMMHEGQEFARSKVIAPFPEGQHAKHPDIHPGRLDANSYEKDDETNWLHFHHAKLNSKLVDYYKGLIEIRKSFLELRQSPDEQYRFVNGNLAESCGFILRSLRMQDDMLVALMNISTDRYASFNLPDGMWSVIVDDQHAGLKVLKKGITQRADLPPTSGMLLVKEFESRFG